MLHRMYSEYLSLENFTPTYAHESSRAENKRNAFSTPRALASFSRSSLRGFLLRFSLPGSRSLAESRAHPVTPTSLPAWIWDTVDRKKLNGHIIFWKEDTRAFGRGEHMRREWNETSACGAAQSTTSFSKIMRAITECEHTIITTLPQVQLSKQCDRDGEAVWFKSHTFPCKFILYMYINLYCYCFLIACLKRE